MSERVGARLTVADRIMLRWWRMKAWFHRCPECGRRPYGREEWMPRWADDKVAQMLGVADEGCPECGKADS